MTSHVGIITVLLLTLWTVVAAPPREHDRCPTMNFPPSSCKLQENCDTLVKYFEAELLNPREVPTCGFKTAFASMMYCCPDDPPALVPNTTTPINTSPTVRTPIISSLTLVRTHLATLEYLEPVYFDDFVYHCTGIILTSTFVLATSKCVGQNIVDKPNKVLLGVTDPRLYVDTQIEIEIKNSTFFNNDLVLFELDKEISQSQLGGNVTLAQRCYKEHLNGQPNLFAVGFAHDQQKNTNCGLFQQSLRKVNVDQCANVTNNRSVQQIGNSHLCVVPGKMISGCRQTANCSRCLTASSSVLHIQLPNGSSCVAGIATPTTDECIVNREPLLYTTITNDPVTEFLIRSNVF